MSDSSEVTVIRRTPSIVRITVVTVIAALASVALNAMLVWIAKASDESIQHYAHFRLADYGTLTAVGVIGAGVAWYLATRYVASPRTTLFRVAVAVMLVLWLPDVWILVKHEPARAVLFLALMHVSVAIVTYNLLVIAAPAPTLGATGTPSTAPRSPRVASLDDGAMSMRVPRGLWVVLLIAVGVEFVSGILGMVYIPFNRHNGWFVHRGTSVYLVHAVLGGILGLVALAVVVHVLGRTSIHRLDRIGAVLGLCGSVVGAIGGVLSDFHPVRLVGMALMFAGVTVAFFGYLIPMFNDVSLVAPESVSTT